MEVVNLFAYRATDPRDMAKARDPVGPENRHHVLSAMSRAYWVIAAWGGSKFVKTEHLQDVLRERTLLCLGLTGNGHPRHPLYVPKHVRLVEFNEKGTTR
jgi:hypothetical protein